MKNIKKIIKKYLLVLEHYFYLIIDKSDNSYGEIGYFIKSNPITTKYTYANWGSRLWELSAIESWLNNLNIKGKKIVDIGIGLPSDSNFYKYYVDSGCYLNAYDLDPRIIQPVKLSDKCVIFNKSSDQMTENTDNSVDIVVAISSLEHYSLKSFNKTISEVYRILKPNGLFLITLDLTYNKTSAKWAILEKTINGLPEKENEFSLSDSNSQLTIENFLERLSPKFYVKDSKIRNNEYKNSKNLLYSKKWNSHIAYIHLYKK